MSLELRQAGTREKDGEIKISISIDRHPKTDLNLLETKYQTTILSELEDTKESFSAIA